MVFEKTDLFIMSNPLCGDTKLGRTAPNGRELVYAFGEKSPMEEPLARDMTGLSTSVGMDRHTTDSTSKTTHPAVKPSRRNVPIWCIKNRNKP